MEFDIVPFQARLERLAFNNHMQIVQFADITSSEVPEFKNFTRAMVIGQSFGDLLMDKFNEETFKFHLELIKKHVALTAYQIYHLLTIEGYDAMILEPVFLKGENRLSDLNRMCAKLAGVGDSGENGFFVSPTYGVKIVLCSVITNSPLEFDSEYNVNLCKQCNICKENDFLSSVVKCPYGKNKYKTDGAN